MISIRKECYNNLFELGLSLNGEERIRLKALFKSSPILGRFTFIVEVIPADKPKLCDILAFKYKNRYNLGCERVFPPRVKLVGFVFFRPQMSVLAAETSCFCLPGL